MAMEVELGCERAQTAGSFHKVNLEAVPVR